MKNIFISFHQSNYGTLKYIKQYFCWSVPKTVADIIKFLIILMTFQLYNSNNIGSIMHQNGKKNCLPVIGRHKRQIWPCLSETTQGIGNPFLKFCLFVWLVQVHAKWKGSYRVFDRKLCSKVLKEALFQSCSASHVNKQKLTKDTSFTSCCISL